LVGEKRLSATADMTRLAEPDGIVICVPTPLSKNREPDMTFIVSTSETLAKYLRPGQLIALESTTYPGTTREVVKPILEKSGLSFGRELFLAYSPERVDPGNEEYQLCQIPKVVGGLTKNCTRIAQSFYGSVFQSIFAVSSLETAEMSKLLENIYRAVNIALVNEMKMLSERMGLDIWEIISAAATKPFGYKPFYPGPGLGGHCIPIDPFYLTWKARQFEFPTRFIELAGEINTSMPYYVVSKTMEAMNRRGICLNGSRILVLGVAYKPDIDDMRESPALRIMEILEGEGAKVDYNDPYIPKVSEQRQTKLRKESVKLSEEALKQYDAVIVVTNHSSYDYRWIVNNSKLVVDTRGATKGIDDRDKKIISA
jgi:UDP-N-acetyl-D-glucosamine dehydrogenase